MLTIEQIHAIKYETEPNRGIKIGDGADCDVYAVNDLCVRVFTVNPLKVLYYCYIGIMHHYHGCGFIGGFEVFVVDIERLEPINQATFLELHLDNKGQVYKRFPDLVRFVEDNNITAVYDAWHKNVMRHPLTGVIIDIDSLYFSLT